ncbi:MULTISPECIES: dienelactone hydrolase family protein [unclassified Streptomyces]|uniref:dienelactone hydrolase family protein n=1 Tax=unclassified Streptomyces TaxID=2593676 RepID=UPI0016614ECD|nr:MULTISPECIES: alpha/beta hydrolase [unclassified Streptomyces]MBD0711152.1 alpha/beta hydrolase [Streptomyces sp. CBMA291]MBD0714183.1 alpha/beta hydrolase [Streptomyces sp. CBMA370]
MYFTSEQRLDDGVLEREFLLGEIPGVLWTPGSGASGPLILIGHPGGLHKRLPWLVKRARHYAARYGFTVAAIDAPGCGGRPRSTEDDTRRAAFRQALESGELVDEVIEAFIRPLVDRAVPEWQATLDALLALPGIDGPVGYDGMVAIGIRLAVVDPRVEAAAFFGQTFVPESLREEARRVAVPVQFLMQWDDEGMDRQPVLDLFDVLGTKEKTLHANLGGHTGTPWFEVDDAARFFSRHLT